MQIPFENSAPGTFTLALELQIVDQASFSLVARGADIVADLDGTQHASRHVRSGVRQDFLEFFSSVHEHPVGLLAQMQEIQQVALTAAQANDAYLMGGGAYPNQASGLEDASHDELDSASASFFGAKVLISVSTADESIRLVQALAPYVPHIIGLSACSPLLGGQDRGVASMRLQAVTPRLASMPRRILCWSDFEHYLERRQLLSGESLHWEIVPRPDQGAVEIQIMDSALTIERACLLAGWLRVLAEWALRQDDAPCPSPVDLAVNRYQATLFGLQATYVGADGRRMFLRQALRELMDDLVPIADEMGCLDLMNQLVWQVEAMATDAEWLRHQWSAFSGTERLVEAMVQRFDSAQMSTLRTPPWLGVKA